MDYTPLLIASAGGHIILIKMWIASGKEINLGVPGSERSDAILVTKKVDNYHCLHLLRKRLAVVALLERFRDNPDTTRHVIRSELGWYDELAAALFALVVFVSDSLLQITMKSICMTSTRFFIMMEKLPLELQMLVCYRVAGLSKGIITQKHGDAAFKKVAKTCLC